MKVEGAHQSPLETRAWKRAFNPEQKHELLGSRKARGFCRATCSHAVSLMEPRTGPSQLNIRAEPPGKTCLPPPPKSYTQNTDLHPCGFGEFFWG